MFKTSTIIEIGPQSSKNGPSEVGPLLTQKHFFFEKKSGSGDGSIEPL